MVNCNPETVSTDYDTSDRLYFEPLDAGERSQYRCDTEKPDGVIVQFGGQTPLTLALPLKAHGIPIIGTDPESIDLAEDRERFGKAARGASTFHHRPTERPPAPRKRFKSPAGSVTPFSSAPATCSAVAPWSSPTTKQTVESYMREAVVYSQERPVLDRPFSGRRHRGRCRRAVRR